jgi:prepilin-type N-terminal cleavage/methylation domain-containing protein
MRALKDHSLRAFTLLEILIVVIIISVLASLALPRFGSMIERTRAMEAMNMLGVIRYSMERCYVMGRDYSKCLNAAFPDLGWGRLGMANPNNAVNTHFTYGYGVGVNTYSVWAIRNSNELSTNDPGGTIPNICGNSGTVFNSQIFLCVENTGLTYLKGIGLYEHVDTTPQ